MKRLFGTDGIRGRVNHPPLVPEKVLRIAQGIASYWQQTTDERLVIIGHDGRTSGDYLVNLVAAGLQSGGFKVARLGLCSTPSLAFATRGRETAGGVMISASHNPYHDNGIKLFNSSGAKLLQAEEEKIEQLIDASDFHLVEAVEITSSLEADKWLAEYLEVLADRSVFYPGRILVDCANGGASRLVEPVLEDSCNALITVNTEPDGTNINLNCGSLNLKNLRQEMEKWDVDIGFALDGDADRLLAIDEKGEVVDGDLLLYMLASHRAAGQSEEGVVLTVMTNLALLNKLKSQQIDYRLVDVGDRQVYHKLIEQGWSIGGEQSGHIIDRNWLPTGDGLHSILLILQILSEAKTKLYEWNRQLVKYPQVLKNFEVSFKPELNRLESTTQLIEKIEKRLGDEGRLFVRYSGTEPLVRVMLEGKNKDLLEEYADQVGLKIQQEIADLEQ